MYEVFDQGTNREALIKGMEEKLKGSYRFAWKLKGKIQNSKFKIMKRETWKLIVQILISILTALGTTLGVTSCM